MDRPMNLAPLLQALTVSRRRSTGFGAGLAPTRTTQRRGHKTQRRNRKALNVPPAPIVDSQFLPQTGGTGRSWRSPVAPVPQGDTIVFNPPSAAPNVHHTPPIFLPKEDPRRQLLLKNAPSTGSASYSSISTTPAPSDPLSAGQQRAMPPTVRHYGEKKYHLGPTEITEMRRLRQQDSEKWTRKKLQEKFQCSNLFVATVVHASDQWKRKQIKKTELRKSAWGPRRRKARVDRARRKEMWSRGE